jgi:pimeloyl-ACP methyl ester carboxylesterase
VTAADQARGRLVELDRATVHVTESGPPSGRPVVLVHGFRTDSTTWRHVVPGLAERYRTVLVDLPACGGSPVPDRTGWTADAAADLLVGLLDALELRDPVLVGSQMGGSLTAWARRATPTGSRGWS